MVTIASRVTIKWGRLPRVARGRVTADETRGVNRSDVSAHSGCKAGRTVVLFKPRPGKDKRLGRTSTNARGKWKRSVPSHVQGRVYAKVKRAIRIAGDRTTYVCRPDRSRSLKLP